ncbi:hypothetical protein [Clostridium sp. UBA6640]|nr:hypothetical protein [Clostridium sp. UBA6640]
MELDKKAEIVDENNTGIKEFTKLSAPVISTIIGEGKSDGAI